MICIICVCAEPLSLLKPGLSLMLQLVGVAEPSPLVAETLRYYGVGHNINFEVRSSHTEVP